MESRNSLFRKPGNAHKLYRDIYSSTSPMTKSDMNGGSRSEVDSLAVITAKLQKNNLEIDTDYLQSKLDSLLGGSNLSGGGKKKGKKSLKREESEEPKKKRQANPYMQAIQELANYIKKLYDVKDGIPFRTFVNNIYKANDQDIEKTKQFVKDLELSKVQKELEKTKERLDEKKALKKKEKEREKEKKEESD